MIYLSSPNMQTLVSLSLNSLIQTAFIDPALHVYTSLDTENTENMISVLLLFKMKLPIKF